VNGRLRAPVVVSVAIKGIVTRSLLAVFAFWTLGALAQSPASYQGADREQRLLAGAKKEGEVVIYTSGQADDMGALARVFEQKYGVKVTFWRASSENVLQRLVAEARGGRYTVDVLETNGPELESAQREGLLVRVNSPILPT
jgi:iron(III) transport system substrate-binding protein